MIAFKQIIRQLRFVGIVMGLILFFLAGCGLTASTPEPEPVTAARRRSAAWNV